MALDAKEEEGAEDREVEGTSLAVFICTEEQLEERRQGHQEDQPSSSSGEKEPGRWECGDGQYDDVGEDFEREAHGAPALAARPDVSLHLNGGRTVDDEDNDDDENRGRTYSPKQRQGDDGPDDEYAPDIIEEHQRPQASGDRDSLEADESPSRSPGTDSEGTERGDEGVGHEGIFRVKVYSLNQDSTWNDRGTGYVSVQELKAGGIGLVVVSEVDGTKLLFHRVTSDVRYTRHSADTIITWQDPDMDTDIGLSFQKESGCSQVWVRIVSAVSERDTSHNSSEESGYDQDIDESDVFEKRDSGPAEGAHRVIHVNSQDRQDDPERLDGPLIGPSMGDIGAQDVDRPGAVRRPEQHPDQVPDGVLPTPLLGNLAAIADALSVVSPFHRDKVSIAACQNGYVNGLMEIFRTCEDLEDMESLGKIYTIVRSLILLNDQSLFEIMFASDCILNVVGALEYSSASTAEHGEPSGGGQPRDGTDPDVSTPGVHGDGRGPPEGADAASSGTNAGVAYGRASKNDDNDELGSAHASDDVEEPMETLPITQEPSSDAAVVETPHKSCLDGQPCSPRPDVHANEGGPDSLVALDAEADDVGPTHRDVIRDCIGLRTVIRINEEHIVEKIRQTFRIGYMKDVVLPTMLDDETYSTLASMQLLNTMDIIVHLSDSNQFMLDLVDEVKRFSPTAQNARDMLAFLHELTGAARHLQPQIRSRVFGKLIEAGILPALSTAIDEGAGGASQGAGIPEVPAGHSGVVAQLRKFSSDILMYIIQNDPAPVREYLSSVSGKHMLRLLVDGMVVQSSDMSPVQYVEILRMLLDTDSMENAQESFVECFYKDHIGRVLDMLAGCLANQPCSSDCGKVGLEGALASEADAAGPPAQGSGDSGQDKTQIGASSSEPATLVGTGTIISVDTACMLLDLFTFCVYYHGYRVKYFFLRNQALSKITNIARHPDMVIVTAVIRFIRTCLGLKDDFYSRLIVKNDLLGPTMERFVRNGKENNLLHSSVLELLEFARREGLRGVMMYIWERHGEKLKLILDEPRYEIFKYRYNNLLATRPSVHERFVDMKENLRHPMLNTFYGADEDTREETFGPTGTFNGVAAPQPLQRRELDSMEDEAYFNDYGSPGDNENAAKDSSSRLHVGRANENAIFSEEEDDEDPNAAGLNMPVRLVDYDDDDTDDFIVGQSSQELPGIITSAGTRVPEFGARAVPLTNGGESTSDNQQQVGQSLRSSSAAGGGMPIQIRLTTDLAARDVPPLKRQRGGSDDDENGAGGDKNSERPHPHEETGPR